MGLNFEGVGEEEEELKCGKRKWECLMSGSLGAEPEARIWVQVIYWVIAIKPVREWGKQDSAEKDVVPGKV